MEPFLFEAYEALPYVQGIEIGGTDQERTTFRPVFRRRGDDSTVYYEMRDKQHINNPPRLGHIKYCHVLRRYGNTDPPVYQSSNERVIVKVFEFQKVQQHFDSPECPFREMEALRMIVEPNRHVATVDAIMQDRDGNIHMAMPLRKGNCTALDEILLAKERGQRLDTSYARLLFRHLIRGLKYIHQLGLYHGDISCENFIVGEHDSSTPYGYIIDFGVALRAPPHALIHPRLFPGKPCYQSPEVSTQEPFYPEKADIWSCGIVCLNMLTGRCRVQACRRPLLTLNRRRLSVYGF